LAGQLRPDQVSALTGIYQAERSDAAAMQTINAAVVGLAIAYAGVTITLLGQGVPEKISPLVLSTLPAPLWIVAVFLGLFSAAQALRHRSAIVLEHKLFEFCDLSDFECKQIGLSGIERVMDWRRGTPLTKASLIVAFGGELVLVVGYTVLMLTEAYVYRPRLTTWVVPTTIYAALLAVLVATWTINDPTAAGASSSAVRQDANKPQ
jgi:hypothetical protein